jgi:hypothetical protein
MDEGTELPRRRLASFHWEGWEIIMSAEEEPQFSEAANEQGFQKRVYINGPEEGPTLEWWVNSGGLAAGVTALAATVRTYIKRRQGNAVTVWRDGKKIAEVKGDMSADDIVKILEAHEPPDET